VLSTHGAIDARNIEVEELFGEFRVPKAQEGYIYTRGEAQGKGVHRGREDKGRGLWTTWNSPKVGKKVHKFRRENSIRQIGWRKRSGPLIFTSRERAGEEMI
jgi:hypothetical protein